MRDSFATQTLGETLDHSLTELARNPLLLLTIILLLLVLPNLLAANETGNFDPERRNSRGIFFLNEFTNRKLLFIII